MRGSAVAIRRSKNSYIVSRRSVTRQPIGWPSRSLKLAMLWRDLLTTALRPVISPRSLAASSTALFSSDALTPMLTTIFCIRGTWCGLEYLRFSFSAGTTSLTYLSYSLAFMSLRHGFCRNGLVFNYFRGKTLGPSRRTEREIYGGLAADAIDIWKKVSGQKASQVLG